MSFYLFSFYIYLFLFCPRHPAASGKIKLEEQKCKRKKPMFTCDRIPETRECDLQLQAILKEMFPDFCMLSLTFQEQDLVYFIEFLQ